MAPGRRGHDKAYGVSGAQVREAFPQLAQRVYSRKSEGGHLVMENEHLEIPYCKLQWDWLTVRGLYFQVLGD